MTVWPAVFAAMIGSIASAQGVLTLGVKGNRLPIPEEGRVQLSETGAKFTQTPDTWSWIADVEHVIEKSGKKMVFLADADPPYTLTEDTVPGGKDFELMPYHYYDEWEEKQLGAKINFRLFVENRGKAPVDIDIKGFGSTNTWDHGLAWSDALMGKGARKLTLKPGESATLWEKKRLAGGLPWSAIILGRATGDLHVADYAWIADKDPGVEKATQMPDLAWPPYNLGSFNRGSANWNAATIDLFTDHRKDGKTPLSALNNRTWMTAFGYSEGGPPTNPCIYKAIQPTFVKDVMVIKDPVSKFSHVFLGGNYPVMYNFHINIVNDTDGYKEIDYYLASNDVFKVNSLVGVFVDGKWISDEVLAIGKNEQWLAWGIILKPGEVFEKNWTVVALGGKWGGLIGALDFHATGVRQ